jgi:hypothetical protein
VNHSRHYSVEQANAALEFVGERLERLRDARERLGDEEAREALAEAGPQNGGGAPGRQVSAAFLDLRNALTELQEMDVVLRDLERGLVDFPALSPSGREYWLCWVVGEPAVTWWHWPETGFAGRTPLGEPPE